MTNINKHPWHRAALALGFSVIALAGCATVQAPTEQLALSKMAISNAASAGGNEFASAEMRTAQDKLDRANLAMKKEDYKNAQALAEQAQADAQLASAKAHAGKAQKAATTVQEDSQVLRKELERKSQ